LILSNTAPGRAFLKVIETAIDIPVLVRGGLMGRELASAIVCWFVLKDFPVGLELHAVCDLTEPGREWFRSIPTVKLLTPDYAELLSSDVDIVHVAVSHHLHEKIYLDLLRAGKIC